MLTFVFYWLSLLFPLPTAILIVITAFLSLERKKEKMKKEQFEQKIKLSRRKRELNEKEEEIKLKEETTKVIKENIEYLIKKKTSFKPGTTEFKQIISDLSSQRLELEINVLKEKKIKEAKKELQKTITELTCCALERYDDFLFVEKKEEEIVLEKQEIVSKIIGKDGRNINHFRKVTGTDLIINEEEKNKWKLQISSFNSLRKEIAQRTLREIIQKGRITPFQLESIYKEVSQEIDQVIKSTGEKTLRELEISGVHPNLSFLLGKLKYRTSYGQNVLQHSIEVANLAGILASELGLNVFLARRAGLLHDIGKAIDENHEESHVEAGVRVAKTYHEPEEVINAIASHHNDEKVNNFYSSLVIAADKISASRLGARNKQEEAYLKRMNSLEQISNSFEGIKKSYAFQAGREIWIIVDPEKVSDAQAWELTQKIKEQIKKNIVIPGKIIINIIREKRFTQKI